MVWLNEPQHPCATQSQFWCFWRDQTCEPPVMQLISNHPVARPYARFSIYMFTNHSISSTLDLFMPLELMDTFSLDIWCLEIITSRVITPRNVLACFSISASAYVCLHVVGNHVCVCVCVCDTSRPSPLFTALDKLWGCHGDHSSQAGRISGLLSGIHTEPIRPHMKDGCVVSCWMFKAASPLLLHSAIPVVQLSRISWQGHRRGEEGLG